MKNSNLLIAGAIIGIVGAAYMAQRKRDEDENRKMEERLRKKKIEELASNMEIKVDPEDIHEAVEIVVREEVTKQVEIASKLAVDRVANDIERSVKKSVDETYNNIRADVEREVEKQVSHISISDIEDRVIEKTKKEVLSIIDNRIDKIIEENNSKLKAIASVYENIASNIGKSRVDNVIRFNV